MAYPFADGRVVANLGPTSFRRQVISGDNVQVGSVETQSTSPRSAVLIGLSVLGINRRPWGVHRAGWSLGALTLATVHAQGTAAIKEANWLVEAQAVLADRGGGAFAVAAGTAGPAGETGRRRAGFCRRYSPSQWRARATSGALMWSAALASCCS